MPQNHSKARRAVRRAEAEERAANPDLEARAARETNWIEYCRRKK